MRDSIPLGDRLEARAMPSPWSDGIQVLFALRHMDRPGISLAAPLVFSDHQPSATVTEPTLDLPYETAQQLMDELWRCGLRPSRGLTDNKGALEATERHLEDMRKLVFEAPVLRRVAGPVATS